MYFFIFPYRTLGPEETKCACAYLSKDEDSLKEDKLPDWIPVYNLGKEYKPSHNIAPTDITPVLVSAAHFQDDENITSERVLVPMMWSLIPFWHKGDYKKHGLTTNNCRLEGLTHSKLYQHAFKKGQRCVIICEGFYEWQTSKDAKPSERAAFFIYMPQKDGIKIEENKTWQPSDINLLKMAGLFDVWTNDEGDQIYSYTVITYESNNKFSWLHHRTPAILESDQQVADWLDFERVPEHKAIEILRQPSKIVWHRVSNLVNNSKNKSEQCNKPATNSDLKKELKPKSKLMESWLVKRRKPTDDENLTNTTQDLDEGSSSSKKKIKTEEK